MEAGGDISLIYIYKNDNNAEIAEGNKMINSNCKSNIIIIIISKGMKNIIITFVLES